MGKPRQQQIDEFRAKLATATTPAQRSALLSAESERRRGERSERSKHVHTAGCKCGG
jgi:hypothetical protein